MTTSETEIANLAIRHLGVSDEIADLDTDTTVQAQACRAFFDTVRDAVLRDFPWPFATERAALAGQVTEPNDEWGYSYVYPSDCLQARRIVSGNRQETQGDRIRFRVGQDGSSLLIYTDESAPTLEYTKRETDPIRFPPDFVIALSFRLASYIAPSVTGGDPFKLGPLALQRYALEIAQAQAMAGREEMPDELPDASWIAGR